MQVFKLASKPPQPQKRPSPPVSWRKTERDSADSDSEAVKMSATDGLGRFQDYDMEHSKVEAWLDEHPEFFQVFISLTYSNCSLVGTIVQ